MRAIAIRQPWAWAILHGKDIENREWQTTFRGRVLLHASKGCTKSEFADARDFLRLIGLDWTPPALDDLPRGAIVAAMTITDCVDEHSSPFFVGPFGFVLDNVVALPTPIPCKGALGFFSVPADVAAEVRRQAVEFERR